MKDKLATSFRPFSVKNTYMRVSQILLTISAPGLPSLCSLPISPVMGPGSSLAPLFFPSPGHDSYIPRPILNYRGGSCNTHNYKLSREKKDKRTCMEKFSMEGGSAYACNVTPPSSDCSVDVCPLLPLHCLVPPLSWCPHSVMCYR